VHASFLKQPFLTFNVDEVQKIDFRLGSGDNQAHLSGNIDIPVVTDGDYLVGGSGSDTYVFGTGYGQETIVDTDSSADNFDNLILYDIASTKVEKDFSLVRSGDDLLLKITSTGDVLTFANWYQDTTSKVDQVEFSDGTDWGIQTVETATSSIAGPTAGMIFLEGTADNDVIYAAGGYDYVYGLAALIRSTAAWTAMSSMAEQAMTRSGAAGTSTGCSAASATIPIFSAAALMPRRSRMSDQTAGNIDAVQMDGILPADVRCGARRLRPAGHDQRHGRPAEDQVLVPG